MKNRKSMFKKALALAVALVMCVAMLPTAAFAATPVNVQIGNRADFLTFVNDFNGEKYKTTGCNVTLTADINLTNPDTNEATEIKPIGDWSNPFTGTFDGKKSDTENYIISNVAIKGYGEWEDTDKVIRAGLFGCVDSGGKVQNLVLDNFTVISSSTSGVANNDASDAATGIAVATLVKGTVQNVHTTSTCTVEGVFRTGGIVGDTRGTASNVINCVNEATVTGKNLYTGGIVGAAHSVSNSGSARGAIITGCTNGIENDATVGKVLGTSNVGGIVGYADRATVENCFNYAMIEGLGNYGTGGIVGCNVYNYLTDILSTFLPKSATEITSCHNYGPITGGRAGGILGAYISAPSKKQPKSPLYCIIKDCVSNGDITNDIGTADKCGAICGYPISYAQGDAPTQVENMAAKITGCSFTCKINGTLPTVPTPGPYVN